MASEQQHRIRSETDLKMAKSILAGGEGLHWSVVASFYSALHILDAYLAAKEVAPSEDKSRQREKTHDWRKRRAEQYLDFENYQRYLGLYMSSIRARYFPHATDPAQFSSEDVAAVLREAKLFHEHMNRELRSLPKFMSDPQDSTK